jgi:hypothetical protein
MALTHALLEVPQVAQGGFTSAACCAVLVTETLGWQPTYVKVVADSGGTNPNIYEKHATEADENLLCTGSTGVLTSPADAGGITITATGFTFAAAAQVASGVNWYIAHR